MGLTFALWECDENLNQALKPDTHSGEQAGGVQAVAQPQLGNSGCVAASYSHSMEVHVPPPLLQHVCRRQ